MTAKAKGEGAARTKDAGSSRALLFLGESSLVDPMVEEAIAKVLPAAARGLNLEVFHHGEGERPLSEALAALRQVGMFAAERCVWIRGGATKARKQKAETKGNDEAIGEGKLSERGTDGEADDEGRAGDLGEDLMAVLEAGLPAATTLIVSAPSLDARSRAFKWFVKHGVVRDARVQTEKSGGRPDAARTRAIVEQRLAEAGITSIDSGAIDEIVRRGGNNFGELLQEIDRVCSALPEPSHLKVADVRHSMRDLALAWVFDLTAALSARRLGDAERLIGKLLADGEVPLRLVAVLGTHFATLSEAGAVMHLLPKGALAMRGNDFLAGPYMALPESFRRRYAGWRGFFSLQAASNFSVAELRRLHGEVLALDMALKSSTRVSPQLLFTRFLHAVCPAAKPSSQRPPRSATAGRVH